MIILAGSVFERTARGDSIPPASIYELLQKRQDVEVVVQQPSDQYYQGKSRTIVRTQAGEETTVVENVIISELEQAVEHRYCGWYIVDLVETAIFCDRYPAACLECADSLEAVCIGDSCDSCVVVDDYFNPHEIDNESAFCKQYPAYAKDCDSDGVSECCLKECERTYLYKFLDTCVPVGTTTYRLEGDGAGNEDGDPVIDVAPLDTDCFDRSSRSGDGIEEDDVDKTTKNDDGCSVVSPGASHRGWIELFVKVFFR